MMAQVVELLSTVIAHLVEGEVMQTSVRCAAARPRIRNSTGQTMYGLTSNS